MTRRLLADRLKVGPAEPRTTVTVAVCTRNRASQLGECLDALIALDYPADLLDIVIVDNAPADASTRDARRAVSAHALRLRAATRTRWARNRAARDARGDIVAYTDDDVAWIRGWVTALAAAFEEEPHAMCVTGLVAAGRARHARADPVRALRRIRPRIRALGLPRRPGQGAARLYGGTGRFGTGANMAFRRAFFDARGLFDPALDVGTPANGGGDLEMFFRVLKTGHTLVYEPAAMVRHRHRRDYAALQDADRQQRHRLLRLPGPDGAGLSGRARRDRALGSWWLWWWNVRRLLARSLSGRAPFPLDLVIAELQGIVRRPAPIRGGAPACARDVLRQFGHPSRCRRSR